MRLERADIFHCGFKRPYSVPPGTGADQETGRRCASFSAIWAGEDTGEIYKHVDREYVCSYKKMDQNDWILYTLMPKRDGCKITLTFKIRYHIRDNHFRLCYFASIYFSNKISSPIDSITQYINSAESRNEILGNSISETIRNIKTNNFDKEAHALIQKSRKLTASLEMKSYLTARFLSALSHDIRTSLTLIKGYSKGILSGLVEDEGDKGEVYPGNLQKRRHAGADFLRCSGQYL